MTQASTDAEKALVDQAQPKLKGKVSRMLAANPALGIRVDALGELEGVSIGFEGREKAELQLEGGNTANASSSAVKAKPAEEKYTTQEEDVGSNSNENANANVNMNSDSEPTLEIETPPLPQVPNSSTIATTSDEPPSVGETATGTETGTGTVPPSPSHIMVSDRDAPNDMEEFQLGAHSEDVDAIDHPSSSAHRRSGVATGAFPFSSRDSVRARRASMLDSAPTNSRAITVTHAIFQTPPPFIHLPGQSTPIKTVPFASNKIRSARYTWYNFLPLNLAQQLIRPANAYFIVSTHTNKGTRQH